MAKMYSKNISPASSFLTPTGEFVVVAATIDPLIEKHKEEKNEQQRPRFYVYDIKNTVEGSATTIKYMVFHCSNEDEKNEMSTCINKRKGIFKTSYQFAYLDEYLVRRHRTAGTLEVFKLDFTSTAELPTSRQLAVGPSSDSKDSYTEICLKELL